MKYRLPDLPDGQRWSLRSSMGIFTLRLQERRWWGWRTIAESYGSDNGGYFEVANAVDRILRRDYWAEVRAWSEREKAKRRSEIPYGESR